MAIRVLMVTDAEGSYTEHGERFGLTELVTALEDGGCDVTKAHRYPSGEPHTGGADITGFTFTGSFSGADYDEVWLMGFASSNPDGPYQDPAGFALTDQEIEVLATFMNGGGGVFATGDHDDLGADLCAKVPRVRGMRRWTADYGWMGVADPDTFVPDPTRSPPPVGRYRLDTLNSGSNSHFEFQDQSDDMPMVIDPVMHVIRQHVTHVAGGVIGFRQSMPHPLLCGPDGVLNVLPDHMHEGRCQVPKDLNGKFTIGGKQYDEYPALPNKLRVSPEVVAWATVAGRKVDPNFDDPTEDVRDSNTNVAADYFPVIVAYNGRPAGVGRVAVDSTFHHFVNINVTGVKPEFSSEPDPLSPTNSEGFLASPAGEKHYARIKAYWVNIAQWLARPAWWASNFWTALRTVALDPRMKQTAIGTTDLASKYVVRNGATAWTLLTERLRPCYAFESICTVAIADPLSYLLSYSAYIRLTLPDPPPDEQWRRDLAVDKLELAYFALSAIITELRTPENIGRLRSGELDEAEGMRLVRNAAVSGVRRGMTEQAARLERTLRALHGALSISDGHVREQPATVGAVGP